MFKLIKKDKLLQLKEEKKREETKKRTKTRLNLN